MVAKPKCSSPVIVALDYANAGDAMRLVDKLKPEQCRLKVGFELFTSAGPAIVEQIVDRGFEVFLDLKFHDIPNTVASACAAAARLGVWMLNVHASGGRRMLVAAREAIEPFKSRPSLIGVTVLTSHSATDLADIGLTVSPASQVARLAELTKESGLDGVVCSAQEARELRAAHGPQFVLVTPGIRPAGSARGDQERIVTPSEAIKRGAHYIVIGRPITQASDPVAMLASVNSDVMATS